ncbi:Flagellar hook-length control protein [Pseudomonas putida]|uniref:Flagellar hook-length control protein FliK n=2 Tax=Pseudomonas TaxID=286 RepID=A0AAX0W0T5_9PSED|nr:MULTISPECIES: flagellar hook-length control protein FliK [Pseudomonas]MCO7621370.1 flagellar hook-length control protein FliK [Pseudomonas guariconensis]MDM9593154.1 flagellar hook-length control protein FliK [Pseudomonas guariconensis]MDM9605981.1 flagellar hook-length control protein FliK [Pseudomonas guariconensis]MDM9610938.1 flagellar hook-length control protein FliK [Pseudomonas guariconensis]PLV20066.1 flagellar hook-length control protein FliK [Pseudomonas guariconensis]
MPVASNPLLQASVVSKPSRAAAQTADKPQAAGSQTGGFDQVMARQGRDDKATQAKAKDKSDSAIDGKTEPADTQPVADGGKTLPVVDQTSDSSESSLLDASLVAGQVTDAQPGAQLIQAQAEAVAPVLQAAVQPQAAPVETPSEQAPAVEDFDPAADPLANLPTLRLALEQSAQAKGTTSAHAAPTSQSDSGQPDDGQVAVNTLASLIDKPQAEGDTSQPGDKAFSELLDNGLKDTKSASSDTRVDDFANRLASLTQAATPKTANAVPPSPLHQPLPMNQNAWAEGLVNRVMYLSSQNLKSADIQLEPAELGRLDIRVNVAADQSTQVTFISGHAGVRDALDSQVHRLRELFAQQGLAQPDVNVADQSRGQQQQQAQQEGSNLSGVAARRATAGGEDDGELADGAQPVEHQVVIGDSAVDYYA